LGPGTYSDEKEPYKYTPWLTVRVPLVRFERGQHMRAATLVHESALPGISRWWYSGLLDWARHFPAPRATADEIRRPYGYPGTGTRYGDDRAVVHLGSRQAAAEEG